MSVVVLDLETIPAGCPPGVDLREWALACATQRLDETDQRTDFLKPHEQEVVAVGAVVVSRTTTRLYAVTSVDMLDEAGQRLTEPERALLGFVDTTLTGGPTLVGWHTSGFDLPVLRYRALARRAVMANLYGGTKSYERYDYRYGDRHLDLKDKWSGYGASPPLKLAEAAALVGLPAKTVASGSDVVGLVHAGEWDRLRSYVGTDAAITCSLYLRWQLTTGVLSERLFGVAIERLILALPAAPGDGGLRAALTEWGS